MRIFLDTSLLSDLKLLTVSDQIVKRRLEGDEFCLSVITHFQILWGYFSAGLPTERYERLLDVTEMGISPLTKLDAEEAARMRPKRDDLLDALIAASVKRQNATIWTRDDDFLKFLPKAKVNLL